MPNNISSSLEHNTCPSSVVGNEVGRDLREAEEVVNTDQTEAPPLDSAVTGAAARTVVEGRRSIDVPAATPVQQRQHPQRQRRFPTSHYKDFDMSR